MPEPPDLDARVDTGFAAMESGFARIDTAFVEIRGRLDQTAAGFAHIGDLLTTLVERDGR